MNREGAKLEGLQALRAVAALLVVLDHAFLQLTASGHLPAALFEPLAYRLGNAGVAVFFAISGFVMALAGQERRGLAGAGNFMLRRLVRIVPLYWLATLAYAMQLAAQGEPAAPGSLAMSLWFIPYFDAEQQLRPVLGVGWTLNFEMYFYLLFALSLLLPRRVGLGAVTLALLIPLGLGLMAGWGVGDAGAMLKLLASPVLLCFPGGIAAHALFVRLRPGNWTRLAPAMAVGVMACAVWMPLLFAPVAVLLAAFADLEAVRWREKLLLAGESSYSIYLFHGFVLGPLAVLMLGTAPRGLATIGFLGSAIAGALLVGVAVHLLVELPLLDAIRRKLGLVPRVRTGRTLADQVV